MIDTSFQNKYDDWKNRIESLDQSLYSIVNCEVDINEPDLFEQLANMPHPADESGLRNEIEALFNEIINQFESLNSDQRQMIINLMNKNDSLMYSAVIDADLNTEEGFRKNMILFVIEDQGKDTRDAMVALDHYCKHAQEAGYNIDKILKQMAQLASEQDKYGWGSTRDLLLNKIRP